MIGRLLIGLWATGSFALFIWALSTAVADHRYAKMFARWGLAAIWPLLLFSSKGTQYFFSTAEDDK